MSSSRLATMRYTFGDGGKWAVSLEAEDSGPHVFVGAEEGAGINLTLNQASELCHFLGQILGEAERQCLDDAAGAITVSGQKGIGENRYEVTNG